MDFCERSEAACLARLDVQTAVGSFLVPKTSHRATWRSLPSELHLAIYREIGYETAYKSIPGSQNPNNALPVLYSAVAANSRLQGVNRSTYHALQHKVSKENKRSLPPRVITVHWNCIDQIAPLLRLLRSAVEADTTWVARYGNSKEKGQGRKDLTVTMPIIKYLDRSTVTGYTELGEIERKGLEEFVQHMLRKSSEPLVFRVLVPRDMTVIGTPDNLKDVVEEHWRNGKAWQWPDPRTMKSKLFQIYVEAKNFRVAVQAVTDPEVSKGEHDAFRAVLDNAKSVPAMPWYPITQVVQEPLSCRECIADEEKILFRKIGSVPAIIEGQGNGVVSPMMDGSG